jgi:hypothetical protein
MLCFCRLIYVLKDLILQYEILIQNAVQILAIFHNIFFFPNYTTSFCVNWTFLIAARVLRPRGQLEKPNLPRNELHKKIIV